MPSTVDSSPFLTRQPNDETNSRTSAQSPASPFASLSPKSFSALRARIDSVHLDTAPENNTTPPNASPYTNGASHNTQPPTNNTDNKHPPSPSNNPFTTLPARQQTLLLIHGPRQKYILTPSQPLPTPDPNKNELLIQILAVALNPVDWKGPAYGFGAPRYPWVHGRDFAGVVVQAPSAPGQGAGARAVKVGDVVFGPSTDYRDVRKAAFQEYVVAAEGGVARLPRGVSVEEGAALGVGFVAAVTGLGVCFGVGFEGVDGLAGPDLLGLVRGLGVEGVSEDVRGEVFGGERVGRGEWVAVWGGNTTTGQLVVQLAKLAGLRVIAVADLAKAGQRLAELGADLQLDRQDPKRAVDILRAVTGGKLRFAIDVVGSESAAALQDALQQSPSGPQSHLLGFTGTPKHAAPGVKIHTVPIKLFHESAAYGAAVMDWLERLLIAKALTLPEVEVAPGGLEGVNDALDRLRDGTVSGKRIVVSTDDHKGRKSSSSSSLSGPLTPPVPAVQTLTNDSYSQSDSDLRYHDAINADPDRLKFAYWVPNVSGGLVVSKIAQRTNWDLASNVRYARTAEKWGFDYALTQIRFMSGYGAANQHESVSFSQALLAKTERLKVIAALLPGPWNPAVAAKQIASIDQYSGGRIAVNVVSGWFKAEFTSIGQWWLDHAERYRRSREFIECLKGIWSQDRFTYKGDFYQFHDYPLHPKPVNLPGRPHPEIFQGGNSDDAKNNGAAASEFYFMNGNTLEGFQSQMADVRARAKAQGREGLVKFAINGFVICRETEAEAVRVLQEIQGKADVEAVEGFRQQVQNAGASTGNKSGMWADSKFEDLVQYNDGFKTKLIGTREQIADRMLLLKSLGADVVLVAFLHYDEEVERFGRDVLPLVRELEARGRGKDEAYEMALTGDVYRERKTGSEGCVKK